MDYLCEIGGFEDASRLYELPGGKRLLLPMVKRKGVPNALAFAASFPYAWGIGGLLASRAMERSDVATVFDDLAEAGYLSVTVRPNPLQGEVWAAAQPANVASVPRRAHLLDLAGGFEYVWQTRFSASKRKQIRRAERNGLRVECDTTGRLMPVFYELYERSLVRWAKQQHEPLWLARLRAHARDPLHKLQAMADYLGDSCRVWVAWHENRPAAAIVVLQDHNASPVLGAMDKELANTTYANNLLDCYAIRDACEAGCRYYDFGETGFNEGLAHFKSEFGAVSYPYADYHIERLPFTQWDRNLRGLVKNLIGFKDA
jgi:CelD/BcsL family acetyltransferase involved in cellulose biosynthesis